MESKTTLVRSKCGVELPLVIVSGKGLYLNSVATVDLHFALIIFPDDTELDKSFGDLPISAILGRRAYSHDGEHFFQFRFLFEERAALQSGDDFISGLSAIH
jgi:hypothetical protein